MFRIYVTIVVLLLQGLLSMSLAQEKIKLIYSHDKRDFSISINPLTHFIGDNISVDLEVSNWSELPFYIIDFDYYDFKPTIFNKHKAITLGIETVAEFRPEHRFKYNKLKLIKPKETYNYKFKIDSNEIVINSTTELFSFSMVLGYFDYDERLLFFTKNEKELQPGDYDILYNTYREAKLVSLPIQLMKK